MSEIQAVPLTKIRSACELDRKVALPWCAPLVEDDVPPYRRSTRDSDYWLRQCEGFVVEAPGGRVGIIEEIRYHSTAERPDYLVVRAGRIGRRQILIPVREVEEIIPRQKTVRLRADHPEAA